MMNETIANVEIDENLINFNGPEDDEDFEDEDFDVDVDSIGGFDDFDDEDDF